VIGPALGLVAGGGALAWIGYAWVPHLFTPLGVWRAPRGAGRRIALTFDDGPDPEFTPRVLDTLAARGVRATFFLVGERAARAPGTVRAIAAAGHEVASHGWSHRSLWLCGPARTDAEVGRARAALGELTGRAPALFRPPWGMVNAALFGALRRHRQRCVFWSIQPEGLRPAAAPAQVAYVLRRAHPAAIVDLHDAEGTLEAPARLCAALPAMLDGLVAAGYGFGTVSELLAS
jgi:peptidoglycan/xylan/chitin deacetylase (PgdA/CDA1 family)